MKKILFSVIAASMLAFGFTSCSPVDSDDHSLGGSPVDPSSLSVSAIVSADETGQMNLVTITNASNAQSEVRYFFCLDGKTLIETSLGGSVTQIVKKKGDYTAQLYAFSACDQQIISTNFTIEKDWIDPDAPTEPEGWMGFTNGTDLLADWQPDYSHWFSPSDWSGGLDPNLNGDIHSGLTFTIPEGTGSDQWQAQVHIEHNGPVLSASKNYDFSIAIVSGADNVKATVKPQQDGDDDVYFTADQFPLHKGVNVIALSDVAGFDGQFKIALDFAGAPVGTEFTVSRVFLSEHNDANIAPFDYQDSKNLLNGQTFGNDFRFWFADGGWSQIADPAYEGDNAAYFSVTIPDGMGGDQWQGQVHIPFDNVTLSAGKNYNFSIVVIADNNIPGLTVKPQNDADDNQFLSADRHVIAADVPTAIVFTGCPGFDGKFRLCLDFAGTPAGTNVKILDMYVSEQ